MKYCAALLVRLACANPRITWSQARTCHIAIADVACPGFGGAANEAAGPRASHPPSPKFEPGIYDVVESFAPPRDEI